MALAHRCRYALTAAALTALLFAGCAAGDDTEPSPDSTSATHAADHVSPPDAQLPDSPVGRQAQWVVDELSGDAGPTADVAGERFAEPFLAEVPADDVRAVFDQLRPQGPWRPVDVNASGPDAVIGLRDGAGQSWRMVISVDADGAIATLVVQPGTTPDDGDATNATTWDAVHERLNSLDADVGLLAARVTDDGRCEPITRIDAREARPIASIFKLYVLGAVAAAVDAGSVDWSDQLTITDDARSLPSGRLQDEPDGSEVPISEAAAEMIAISDNTGADLLAQLVGRDAVESALAEMGHAEPELNEPFLTTRELFTVGWGSGGLRGSWQDADAAGRQRLLEDLPSGALQLSASDVTDPAWPAGVGWFASTLDVCAAMVSLHSQSNPVNDQMLRDVLGRNRGVNIDAEVWPYVAFKGGSAPGVVTGSWYGERSDEERFVYVMLAAAPEAAAVSDHAAFFGLAEDAFNLLAAE